MDLTATATSNTALIRDRSGGAAREACFDHLGGFDLKPWDQLEDLPLKEVRVSGGLLEEALKSLSVQELDRAVRMLATARTIDIYRGGELLHAGQ